ncbi:AcrVA2 family anti-CRISPR protein [Leptospira alexanderi]|uniref:AcrVA2 family anti-CRISPR protein n=1 Tax=Leptospira alexanderi TaxID=100053 RepID=UPI0009911CE3|nr:hypothetical protein [Leptospira alexanderi]
MRSSRRAKSKKQILERPGLISKNLLGNFPDWKNRIGFALSERGKVLPDWPDYVFAPIAAYFQFCFSGMPDPRDPELMYKMQMVQVLSAIVPWNLSKGIYTFDELLFEHLIDSELPLKVPSDILKRLPSWCIYIEIPEKFRKSFDGFFVHIESGSNGDELRIIFDSEIPIPGSFYIGDFTIEDSLNRMIGVANTYAITNLMPIKVLQDVKQKLIAEEKKKFEKILPLILYVCAENAEFSGTTSHTKYNVRRIEQNRSEITEAPNSVVWDVGKEIGKKLRSYQTENNANTTGESKRPHLRRAHWHHFWRGSREDRSLILHWLPPTLVGME